MDPIPEAEQVAALLVQCGCPRDKSDEMAAMLIKRALQLAPERNESPAQTLAHLLRRMAGGWASSIREPGTHESR